MTTGRINQVCTKTKRAPQEPPERPRVRRQAFRTKNQQKILNTGRVAVASASVSEPSLHSDTSEPGNSGDAQRRPNKYQSRWWCTPKHASKLVSSGTHQVATPTSKCSMLRTALNAHRHNHSKRQGQPKHPSAGCDWEWSAVNRTRRPPPESASFARGAMSRPFRRYTGRPNSPHENSPVITPARARALTRARPAHLHLL